MKKRLMIMGCAPCLKSDLEFIKDHELYDFMAVGVDTIGKTDKSISYVVTYHLKDLSKIREKMSGYNGYKNICHDPKAGADIIVDTLFGKGHHQTTGSSALLGVCYAIQAGYEKIVLVGCPLEGRNVSGHSYGQFRRGWQIHKNNVINKVKSVSGWTKQFLGEPTKEWLES